MRTRKKKWTEAELENNPLIIKLPVAPGSPGSLTASRLAGSFRDGLPRGASPDFHGEARAFFDAAEPVRLEIGCGKGRFIAETARKNPGVRFAAIERDPTVLAAAARLAASGGEESNKPTFLVADASELPEIFSPGGISRLYINFCDPWPGKKKWAKRRLTHGNYLKLYESLLIPEIFFKTDNRQLFEFSVESFSENGWLIKNVSLDLHAEGSQPPDGDVMTEYEEKYSSRDLPIYRLEAYARHNLIQHVLHSQNSFSEN